MNENFKQRILNKVVLLANGCWEYRGGIATNKEIARMYVPNGKRYSIHKIIYAFTNDIDVSTLTIAYRKCNFEQCVNPEHVFFCNRVNTEFSKVCPQCHAEGGPEIFTVCNDRDSPTGLRYATYCKRCAKDQYLRSTYSITIAEYEQLWNTTNGCCFICNVSDQKERLVVDHCHSTGKVRGLLCNTCNTGLGLFKDDTELLEKATKYSAKA